MKDQQELYKYLLDRTWKLTEEWYDSLDKSDPEGVYSLKDPKVIEELKRQNHEFHQLFCRVFIDPGHEFIQNMEDWINGVATDGEHIKTPPHLILREFFRTEEQYLDTIQEFVNLNKGKYPQETVDYWNRLTVKTMSEIIILFRKEQYTYTQKLLKSQRELIAELSSPVIGLGKDLGLLPLVGDIDTGRAKYLMNHTLKQCSSKQYNHLLIDLSGVAMIDTMVAHQIFQLIEALNLIGIQCTLSGIRPEIAQTAVGLGLDFSAIPIASSLEQALNFYYREQTRRNRTGKSSIKSRQGKGGQ